jgi:hypothetical protein
MKAANTLATMKGVRPTASLLAAAACAAALAACGGDEDGSIPTDSGEALISQLDAVQDRISEGDCVGAQSAAAAVVDQVDELPEAVDGELRKTLVDASTNLRSLTEDPAKCTDVDAGATGQSDTVPTEEPPATTTTTEETTTETTTEEPPPEEEENGQTTEPPGGGAPGGNQGGNDGSGGIGSGG